MVIQEYVINLTNGEKVIASEPFDMTGPKTLINRYEKAAPETVFRIGDSINGVCYFKAKDALHRGIVTFQVDANVYPLHGLNNGFS